MPNVVFENYVLGKEIENQLLSHINHSALFTADNDLQGSEGMKKTIHKYSATSGAEVLAQGEGNTKDIAVSYTAVDYIIKAIQTRFPYYDEEMMKDETAVATGIQMVASDIYNQLNASFIDELNKATLTVAVAGNDFFSAFADAVAEMDLSDIGDQDPANVAPTVTALVNKKDVAKIRKNLKDDLKYVEAFVRTGYVGTVAGVSIYSDNLVEEGTILVSTKNAVTCFNKTGVEVETDRDVNTRKNTNYARKYFVTALTNEKQAVKITIA